MKSKLTPFDNETILMIERTANAIAFVEEYKTNFTVTLSTKGLEPKIIKAIAKAVAGRLGSRLAGTTENPGRIVFHISYSEESLPDLHFARPERPSPEVGDVYCRTLMEVRAVKVERDKFFALSKFTGGGSMITPSDPNEDAVYEFITDNGTFFSVPEGWWLVRDSNGRYMKIDGATFLRDYEPKQAPEKKVNIRDIARKMDALYGVNPGQRLAKLSEEYSELGEACKPLLFGSPTTEKQRVHIIDELGDVQIVLMHIATLLGTTPEELIARAYDKILKRQEDPEYMRGHPHSGDYTLCEVCRWRGYLGTCQKREQQVPKYISCRYFEKVAKKEPGNAYGLTQGDKKAR